MKRTLVSLLLLLILLPGCGQMDSPSEHTVTFYYLREEYRTDYHWEEYQFDMPEQVIAPEERTVAFALNRTTELLSLYLSGPLDSSLTIPLPADAKIEHLAWNDGAFEISLTGSFSALSDMEMTLVRACIVSTCLELTHAQKVSVLTTDPQSKITDTFTADRSLFLFTDGYQETTSTNTP